MPCIMIRFLFACGVLGVLLVPAKCDPISVCIEDDRDLRVDCLLNSKPHKINNYEFLWSSGTKQLLISSNVSGSSVVNQYKGKSEVRPLDPVGYRMTLKGFTEDLKQNTTFTCKVSGEPAQVTLGREQIPTCSADSMFLQSCCSWILYLMLFYQLLE